ncbi:MAG: 50S ribosomal protein L18 [Planctomycetes bacterium]|nr:50S ribosomal protein L18 [Planctomycetota bacterium]
MAVQSRTQQRKRRQQRARTRLHGTASRPRLAVFRSNKFLYAQLIDDDARKTIVSASTQQKDLSTQLENRTATVAAAELLGKTIAERGKAAGVAQVCFDRGGYRYHGRVKALASAAREAGLEF